MLQTAYLTGRILTGLAALLAVVAFVIGFVPVRAKLLVYSESGEVVSCGSVYFANENAGDDGCEKKILYRYGLMLLLPVLALVLGGIGLAFLNGTYRKV